MNYVFSFIVGGGLVTLVNYLSGRGLVGAAGITMTLPIVTITSLLIMPRESALKVAAWGLAGTFSVLVFLAVFVVVISAPHSCSRWFAMTVSFLAWFVSIFALRILAEVFRLA